MSRRNRIRSFDEATFKDLDRQYRLNESNDPLVSAFNLLPADDRALMLAYITVGKNKTTLSKLFNVSWPVLDERLWRIQVVVREKYEKLINR